MQRLEVSGAVRPLQGPLGVKGLTYLKFGPVKYFFSLRNYTKICSVSCFKKKKLLYFIKLFSYYSGCKVYQVTYLNECCDMQPCYAFGKYCTYMNPQTCYLYKERKCLFSNKVQKCYSASNSSSYGPRKYRFGVRGGTNCGK